LVAVLICFSNLSQIHEAYQTDEHEQDNRVTNRSESIRLRPKRYSVLAPRAKA